MMSEQLPSATEGIPGGDVTNDALLVIDIESGALSYVNAEAADVFDVPEMSLLTRRAAEIVPELVSLEPRSFDTRIATPAGEREIAVRLRPLRSGSTSNATGAGAIVASIRLRDEPRLEIQRDERLESLWQLVVRRGLGGTDYVRALLREAVRGIGLGSATLARVDGSEFVIEYTDSGERPGTRLPIERSVAGAALLRSGTFAVLDATSAREFGDGAEGMRCFLAAAFRVAGERWVLTFAAAEAREVPFENHDWRYVETVIEALSRGMERGTNDAHIERLAYSDSLTSLPNRAALLAHLDKSLAESERLGTQTAVLFLDIDGFKGVNDTVGHRGGDLVLAEVAQRLRVTLRREEYIGRLGGDEFAIIMPHVGDRREIESVTQRVGGVLTFPFDVDGYHFSLSASIGVATYPGDATTRDDLLACADAAMYAAKDDGGSRVRFRNVPGEAEEARELATASNSSEPRDIGYILCYQPIVDAGGALLLGAEALIRRIHPVYGFLAPERGWSIARDEAGRRALDRWVLREATIQARAWAHAGTPLRIDVNLAGYDRREIDELLADVTLAQDVRRLRIEISPEQFADAERAEEIGNFVEHCARNGIRFALDGFDGALGVLAALSHLPIDTIKLERLLVESVTESSTARAVVEGTIIVAKSLNWSVIAKGVETATQQEALVSLGCDGIQGFYVAHPMTAIDFGTWLRERELVGRPA